MESRYIKQSMKTPMVESEYKAGELVGHNLAVTCIIR